MDCPLSFHDSEEENYDAENQENSNPNIFNVDRICRNRDRGLRWGGFWGGWLMHVRGSRILKSYRTKDAER